MSDDYDQKYTKPELRRRLKKQIQQSDKGGDPGQWSARKSQLLVQEYEKQGGGYKKDHKDQAAKSLEEWTDQNWQTRDGDSRARQGDTTKRYLPEQAWKTMSESEQKATDRKKQQGSKDGQQFVANTKAAKQAREQALSSDDAPTKDELYQHARELGIDGRSDMTREQLLQAIVKAEAERPENLSRDELYRQAQDLDIDGRSDMTKNQLIEAIEAQRSKDR